MLLETISLSLGAIASVTTILKNLQTNRSCSQNSENLLQEMRKTQSRVILLENEIKNQSRGANNNQKLLISYKYLLDEIRKSHNYNSRLEFKRTNHGTWLLVRKREKKSNILRDPEGEY